MKLSNIIVEIKPDPFHVFLSEHQRIYTEVKRNPNVKFGRKAEILSNDSVEISRSKGQMGMTTVDETI